MTTPCSPMQVDEAEDARDPSKVIFNARDGHVALDQPNDASDSLKAILNAQDGHLQFYPGFDKVLQEVQKGRKRKCWMWYIYPSLKTVRQHRMPDMLLPDFSAVVEYLQHPVLGPRLLMITQAALIQLAASHLLAPQIYLFDGQLDSAKVHESCTMFAVASVAIGHQPALRLFVGMIQNWYGGPNDAVVSALREESRTSRNVQICFRMEKWIRRLEDAVKSAAQQKLDSRQTNDAAKPVQSQKSRWTATEQSQNELHVIHRTSNFIETSEKPPKKSRRTLNGVEAGQKEPQTKSHLATNGIEKSQKEQMKAYRNKHKRRFETISSVGTEGITSVGKEVVPERRMEVIPSSDQIEHRTRQHEPRRKLTILGKLLSFFSIN